MTDLLIRKLDPGEELTLRPIFYSAIHEIACHDYTPEQIAAWAPAKYCESDWVKRLRSNQPFVVESDGQLIAFADLQSNGLIDQFFVAASSVRQGVGTLLMNRLLEVAKEKSIAKLHSNVSLTAEAFFRKFGFEIEQRQIAVVSGVELPNARMAKLLVPG
ncbi:GNAT family N-acetyltransferase [Adhaeretor mobilis]|uniref:GNAT family N-acetyltransferase n=1 Tax=Adhaeretor mobilis TaxID=1930276 RepID=UPI001C54E6B6|nr:GNAT family N-acetyltransferase [Adhaeretor mobilis]